MAGRCRMMRSRRGPASRPTTLPPRSKWPSAPSSTAWLRRAATPRPWRARPPEAAAQAPVTKPDSLQSASSAPADDVVVDVRDVHYTVDGRAIFSNLDIKVRRGGMTAVMGPSGTGKPTLLRLITGQIVADSGQVIVLGRDIEQAKTSEIYALRKRMGMLFQNGALLTDISVFENVAFPVREHTDLPEPLIRRLVLTKLEAVGLRGAANLMPTELSGGMARRVALARAIVMDPEILIYDEPFVGLDPISKGVIVRLIQSLNRLLGTTSIVVSHDVREISAIADHSYLLAEGKVMAEGSPAELCKEQTESVHQFM